MSITLICCMDKNRAIGYKQSLLIHLPSDLRHFKEVTTSGNHNIVVMGKNTLESIRKVLPKRINVVLTKNRKYKAPKGVFVYHSVEEVLKPYRSNEDANLCVIGGQIVFEQFLEYANKLEITIIDHVFEKADVWFPEIDLAEWKVVSNIKNEADDNNPYEHYFITYERK